MTKFNENEFHERQIKYQEKVNEILERDIIDKIICSKKIDHYPSVIKDKKEEMKK